MEGYNWSHENAVVTLFSAPNYCYRCGNQVRTRILIPQSPNMKPENGNLLIPESPDPKPENGCHTLLGANYCYRCGNQNRTRNPIPESPNPKPGNESLGTQLH
jgi:hypothetical protein